MSSRHLHRRSRVIGVAVLAAAWLGNAAARGQAPAAELRGAALELNEENDWFAGTDRHYTQGARILYLGAEHAVMPGTRWDYALPGFRPAARRWGGEVGQSIYTPENLSAQPPPADDRPYAGWLYAGLVCQRRGQTAGGLPVLENLRLQVGIIGPYSGAEKQQEAAHFIGGFQKARGWNGQLPNEPAAALKAQRTWRLAFLSTPVGAVDLLPQAGLSLGSMDTSLRAGFQLRIGWPLPDDFGSPTIEALAIAAGGRPAAARRRGFHIFGGGEGRAVAYNTLLDGSVFRSSASVDTRPFVFEGRAGCALQWDPLDLLFSMVLRSEEFVGQNQWDSFGSISLRWNF